MQPSHRFFATLFALALVFVPMYAGASAAAAPAADITVGEGTAGISGSSLWELNADAAGNLYASDTTAPAILKVNAANGQYTWYVFPLDATFLIEPGDAKPDTSGNLWFSNYAGAFGKLIPGALQAEYWDVTSGDLIPAGFAFDPSGRLWFTQEADGRLARFTPSSRELCLFAVGGGGDYAIAQGTMVWLTDLQAGRLLRFDTSNNQLRVWTLPAGWQTPQGLAIDRDGRVWWADSGAGVIGRLTPGTNQVVLVTLPAGSAPVMVAAGTEVVWYADANGFAGFVDPAQAGGSAQTVGVATSTVALADCSTLAAGTVQTGITQQTGTFSFAAVGWTTATGLTGVTRYAAPHAGEPPPLPWGITLSEGRTWTVDQNRNVLARTPRLPQRPVVAIQVEAGGNRLTWSGVTLDEGNEATVVASYQVWRDSRPDFRPWDAGVTLATTTGGTNVLDPVLAAPGSPVFYGVRSVAQSGLLSRTSAHTGAFAYSLVR